MLQAASARSVEPPVYIAPEFRLRLRAQFTETRRRAQSTIALQHHGIIHERCKLCQWAADSSTVATIVPILGWGVWNRSFGRPLALRHICKCETARTHSLSLSLPLPLALSRSLALSLSRSLALSLSLSLSLSLTLTLSLSLYIYIYIEAPLKSPRTYRV